MFEQWNIGNWGTNYIMLEFCEDEIKPVPEYIKFNIKYEGEKFSFHLHYTQCESLLENLKKFTDLSRLNKTK
jgi:hypothetical protein